MSNTLLGGCIGDALGIFAESKLSYHIQNVEDSEKIIVLDSQLFNRNGGRILPV